MSSSSRSNKSSKSNKSNRSTGSSDSVKFQKKYLIELKVEAQRMTIKKLKERIETIESIKREYQGNENVQQQLNKQIELLTDIRNRKKQEEKLEHPFRSAIAHYATKGFVRGGKTRRRSGKHKNRKSFRKTRKH
jgi:preprotein translocase subunit SecF